MMVARMLLPLALLTFSLVVLAAGPASKPADKPAVPKADFTLTQADSNKVQEMKVGQVLAVNLKGNPTTGYQWVLSPIDGNAVEQVGALEYAADQAAPGMVGVGGAYRAVFKAVRAGKAVVSMQYVRPWEKNKPAVEVFTLEIRVQAGGASQPAITSSPASAPVSGAR